MVTFWVFGWKQWKILNFKCFPPKATNGSEPCKPWPRFPTKSVSLRDLFMQLTQVSSLWQNMNAEVFTVVQYCAALLLDAYSVLFPLAYGSQFLAVGLLEIV